MLQTRRHSLCVSLSTLLLLPAVLQDGHGHFCCSGCCYEKGRSLLLASDLLSQNG